MMPEELAARARGRLHAQVGGFFTNTRRGAPLICAVCTGPAASELCPQCAGQRANFGGGLADLVVPLAYVKGWMNPPHQSEHHVRQYKHPRHPAPKCVTDLSLMMLAGSLLHGACIAQHVGWWGAVTFVPSASRPGPEHPVAELARQIAPFHLNASRILLEPGPGFASEPSRAPRSDRFVVSPQFVGQVAGRHVLVVDDTWVSGAKAQSASLALKAVGAVAVTVICIGRWLRYTWPDHRQLIETLHEPYNAMMCPVTGGACPAAG